MVVLRSVGDMEHILLSVESAALAAASTCSFLKISQSPGAPQKIHVLNCVSSSDNLKNTFSVT